MHTRHQDRLPAPALLRRLARRILRRRTRGGFGGSGPTKLGRLSPLAAVAALLFATAFSECNPAYFGDNPQHTIAGRVWGDADRDGRRDATEAPVPGVPVHLLDHDGVVVATTETSADGRYRFLEVPRQPFLCYWVRFYPAHALTRQHAAHLAFDSDPAPGTGTTDCVELPTLLERDRPPDYLPNLFVDAGILPDGAPPPGEPPPLPGDPGQIGGHVWWDFDDDGLRDPGEPFPLDGTRVAELLRVRTGQPSQIVDDAISVNGAYLFQDVPPGVYEVRFLLDGRRWAWPNVGDDESIDSDADPITGLSPRLHIVDGEVFMNVDAGAVPDGGQIRGRVWLDANRNGLEDAEEVGVSRVSAELLLNGDLTAVIAATSTADDGDYVFVGLEPGEYRVRFEVGGLWTEQYAGDNPAIDSEVDPETGVTGVISLAADEIVSNVDAGMLPDAPPPPADSAEISGRIWFDEDGDGLQDPGEPGIGDAGVVLLDSLGQVLDNTNPDPDGDYVFSGLAAGTYQLRFIVDLPFTTPDVGGDDTIDSDVDPATALSPMVTLGDGEVADIDAGLVLP